MSGKTKGTFRIEKSQWIDFVNLCKEHGTTASEEIVKFIDLVLSNGHSALIEPDNLGLGYQTLRDFVLMDLMGYVDQKLAYLEQEQGATINPAKTDGENIAGGEYLGETPSEAGAEGDTGEDSKPPEKESKKHSQKKKALRSKIERKNFSDKEVAEREGLSREAIRRYKKKIRNPKDPSFWERWRVNEGGVSWQKLD